MKKLTRNLIMAALALAMGGSSLSTEAATPKCSNSPRERWMKEDEIRERVKGFGKGEIVKLSASKKGCYVAQVKEVNGPLNTIYLNPVTGEITKATNK